MWRYVWILKGRVAFSFSLPACREDELQPTDFMDLIFRILTTSDSRPSITPKLSSVTPCGFSCSFLPAPRFLHSFVSQRLTQTLYAFTLFAPLSPPPCIPHCAVPCQASGTGLVLQWRSLILCFKKLSGRMWLISFYTKRLSASHSISLEKETCI